MRILALNSGSSSIKCALIDSETQARLAEINVEQIGGQDSRLVYAGETRPLSVPTYEAATQVILDTIRRSTHDRIDAVAHRIVHGGSFTEPVIVDSKVLDTIDELSALAPLHNPPALAVLKAAQAAFANVPHVAVFDTSFHRTLPPRAREYALPRALSKTHALRRLGFHGINHAHVMQSVAAFLRTKPEQLRIVSCHLGNGASVAAIEYGRSVETSMGLTPLEGLVMGTRGGDVDPGILLHLLKSGEFDANTLDRLLNKESGLAGLTGTFDFAAIEQRAAAGDEDCRLAITLYTHRLRKYIGAYAAVMGGVDAIAFTGGVGEHSAIVRHRASQRLDFLGASIDEDRNRDALIALDMPVIDISADTSRVRLLVVRADEQLQMAQEAAALLARVVATNLPRIPVAVSARHAHLTAATIEALFGSGYQLTKRADLSQHGQFAAQETVALIGPKGRIDNVRLMGPPRNADQVEISRSDEFTLGIDAPVRLSGDLKNSPGITLVGPRGRVTIPNGVICARRHIHMNIDDAQRFNVRDRDTVDVRIDSNGRDLTFSDVIVRVDPSYSLQLHLDTDEANAAEMVPNQEAELLVPR
jgi:acetate kinase